MSSAALRAGIALPSASPVADFLAKIGVVCPVRAVRRAAGGLRFRASMKGSAPNGRGRGL